ncbi:MAG: hypothetical protein J6Y77_05380 [Paludibacteraceae bacterium]|nr:hypothetical protein [Paludibacteraceae bacterium]
MNGRWTSICRLIVVALAFVGVARAEEVDVPSDTVGTKAALVKRSWFVVPIAFYQEETSVGFGFSGGYYFKSQSLKEINSLSGSVIYTLRNQAKMNLNSRFYNKKKDWYMVGNVQLRYYPEKFFGIGNEPLEKEWLYTSEAVSANFQPFWRFSPGWQVGPRLDVRAERVLADAAFEADRQSVCERYGTAGWQPYFNWSLGVQLMYDDRDNPFYPLKFSNFFKGGYMGAYKALGSSYTVQSVSADFRQYVPTWLGQVFAWQLKLDFCLGRNVPFELLPTLGGSDLLRGFRERRFTDNSLVVLQAEYRIPVYGRLKAALFCGVGDVFDCYQPLVHQIKVGYGGGLRYRLNDARVHLRVDFAGNNYGEFKFYITATEAF